MAEWLSQDNHKRTLLWVLTWILLAAGAIVLRSVLLPFLLAVLLAYVLNPMVSTFQRITFGKQKIPRWVSVIFVYILFSILFLIFLAIFLPIIYAELVKLGDALAGLTRSINEDKINEYVLIINNWLAKYHLPIMLQTKAMAAAPKPPHILFFIDASDLVVRTGTQILQQLQMQSTDIVVHVQHAVARLFEAFVTLIVTLVVTALILSDATRIRLFILNLAPKRQRRAFEDLLSRLDSRLSGVIRGQLVICTVNAILTLIGLLLLNIKYALTLACIAGLFSLIPVFGTILSTIPIAITALTSSPVSALLAVLWIIGIHFIEAHFLNPKILGKSAKIHPIFIILALLTGEHFYGLIGLLLAVPIASILITFFLAIVEKAMSLEEGVAKEV